MPRAIAACTIVLVACIAVGLSDARPLPKHFIGQRSTSSTPTVRPRAMKRATPKPPTFAAGIDPVCDPTRRTDCGYVGINEQQCVSKGCCWQPTAAAMAVGATSEQPGDTPWCFYKVGPLPTYSITSAQQNGQSGWTFMLQASDTSSGSISPLQADITFDTADRIHLKIHDPNNERWEIPQNVLPYPSTDAPGSMNYAFSYTSSPVTFAVTRLMDGEVLFNLTSLQFQAQFLSVTTPLGVAPRLYGIGEHVDPLLLNTFNSHSYTLWNADVPTPVDQNIYGAHPFWLEIRGDQGATHGVFLRNSNGMDIILNHDPVPFATYNIDGGVLDFFIMIGPDPKQAVAQYHDVIGHPHMPPYWSLGWHQCKYGWPNLQTLKDVVGNYSAAGIPLDTMWSDIDHMNAYEDFSFDPVNYPPAQMAQWVASLHANQMQYVVIVDPGIHTRTGYAPYDQGLKDGIFIMRNDGVTPYVGTVWPGQTSFPDWFNPNTQAYWSDQISTFLSSVPIDGLWIDMNEISNFGNGDDQQTDLQSGPNNPPYSINNFNGHAPLNTKTIAMDCLHYPYNATYYEYNTHNLFGLMEGIATKNALESFYNRRSFVLSRSTFAGSGHHVAHWLGDNYASFQSMAESIPGILDMNIYGVPLVGADICGFLNPTTEELCARWSALGAFYPFSRNHHDIHSGDQEPYLWASVTRVAKQTLGARYSLLPYYYTLFYQAWKQGGTVARPLFFEFPTDENTIPIDQQFMIGSGLLITPVLTQGATTVSGYVPTGAVWYDFWTGESQETGSVTFNAPMEYIPVSVRGGTIFPMHVPALTTAATRANPFTLLAALDASGAANGVLYNDDGRSLSVDAQSTQVTFSVVAGTLTSQIVQSNQPVALPDLSTITVWGVDVLQRTVQVNGQTWSDYTYDSTNHILTVQGLQLPITQAFTVTW